MNEREKFIAKTKGGKTRRLAKTGTKLRIGATKKAMGPVGGLPVDEKGLWHGCKRQDCFNRHITKQRLDYCKRFWSRQKNIMSYQSANAHTSDWFGCMAARAA